MTSDIVLNSPLTQVRFVELPKHAADRPSAGCFPL
jgi:hypothetical protein